MADILDGTTPGPWRVEPDSLLVETVDDGFGIAGIWLGEEYPDWEDQAKANAKLIALSPDLAAQNAAMREALEAVDEMFSRPGTINKITVRDKVRKALSAHREDLA